MFGLRSKHSYTRVVLCCVVFLTCVVMSQPSSRLSRTHEPLSRSSTRNSVSCRILCSCGRQTDMCTWTYVQSQTAHADTQSKNPLRVCVPMRNVYCLWVVSHRGQSDSQDNKNYTFILLMQVCSPGKMASNWIYSLCESHTCLMSQTVWDPWQMHSCSFPCICSPAGSIRTPPKP